MILINIIFNYAGRAFGLLANYFFIPVMIIYLSDPDFDIYILLSVLFSFLYIFDFGFSSTAAREIHDGKYDSDKKLFILGTYEQLIIFILFTIFLIYSILNYKFKIIYDDKTVSILIIAATFSAIYFQFYVKILMGIEKQIEANLLNISKITLKNALPLFVYVKTGSIYYFLATYFLLISLFCFIARIVILRALGNAKRATANFDFKDRLKLVASNFTYSMSLFFVLIVLAVNTQLDKLLIGHLYGDTARTNFVLAWTLANISALSVTAVGGAVLPRFVATLSIKDEQNFRFIFFTAHKFCGIIAVHVAVAIAAYGKFFLDLWTSKPSVGLNAAPYVAWLAVGCGFLALQVIVANVLFATKNTKVLNKVGGLSLLVSLPGYIMGAIYFGPLAVSIIWAIINIAQCTAYYFIVGNVKLNVNMLQLYFPAVVSSFSSLFFICILRFIESSNYFIGHKLIIMLILFSISAILSYFIIFSKAERTEIRSFIFPLQRAES